MCVTVGCLTPRAEERHRWRVTPLGHSPIAVHDESRDTTDRALIARVNQSDPDAFRELFEAYGAALVRYGQFFMRSEVAVAEDVVHDLFTYLWTHRHTLAVDRALRMYLYRAVRNRCTSVMRHERVKQHVATRLGPTEIAPPVVLPSPDRENEIADLREAIERAIAELPPRGREIWRLNRTEGMSYAEIAALLGLSVKTIETHMARALRSLRESLAVWR